MGGGEYLLRFFLLSEAESVGSAISYPGVPIILCDPSCATLRRYSASGPVACLGQGVESEKKVLCFRSSKDSGSPWQRES